MRAPSTLGTFLRSFTWGHVAQLDRVSASRRRAWAAGAGPGQGPVTMDVDSTICETYGLGKSKVGPLHLQPRRVAITRSRGGGGTGDVVHVRLRGGNAHTGRGAAGFLTETFNRVRAAGATGPLVLRADSGFYSRGVVDACRGPRCASPSPPRLSQRRCAQGDRRHRRVGLGRRSPTVLDGADVAETTYQPFGAKGTPCPAHRAPGAAHARAASWRCSSSSTYHAFITDRDGETLELEADHRRHAEVENAIRDLKYGVGLNHLPSGRFGANAAWLALNVMAHNLARFSTRLGLGEPSSPPRPFAAAT